VSFVVVLLRSVGLVGIDLVLIHVIVPEIDK
jgi:hypothetical protein